MPSLSKTNIELELPKWTKDKHIYILAGIELAAYKYLDDIWHVKTSRCSMCGKCCEKFGCEKLVKDGDKKICELGSDRPFSCCIGTSDKDYCTEKFT